MSSIYTLNPPSWRPLRPEELPVRLEQIETTIEEQLARFGQLARTIVHDTKDKVVAKALGVSRPDWNQLKTITVTDEMAGYRGLLQSYMQDMYLQGKMEAAQELNVTAPITTDSFSKWVESKTNILVDLQTSALEARTRNVILGILPDESIEEALTRVFDNFSQMELTEGGELIGVQALQAGRTDVRELYDDRVLSYTYTAVLDRKVCPICHYLDGITWKVGDKSMIVPPLHFWCRCLLVPTLVGARYRPTITGLPVGFELPPHTLKFLRTSGSYLGKRGRR
jgi:hypothetical protein